MTSTWFVFLVRLNLHLVFFVLYFIFKKKKKRLSDLLVLSVLPWSRAASGLWLLCMDEHFGGSASSLTPEAARRSQMHTGKNLKGFGPWLPCGASWPTGCTLGWGGGRFFPYLLTSQWSEIRVARKFKNWCKHIPGTNYTRLELRFRVSWIGVGLNNTDIWL